MENSILDIGDGLTPMRLSLLYIYILLIGRLDAYPDRTVGV